VVAKAGYRIGDRVVRAAQVLVVDPPSGPTEPDRAEPAPEPATEPATDAAAEAEPEQQAEQGPQGE
jgi:molecular chaperone GrpE